MLAKLVRKSISTAGSSNRSARVNQPTCRSPGRRAFADAAGRRMRGIAATRGIAGDARAGSMPPSRSIARACVDYPQSLDACLGAAGVLVDLWSIDEAVAAYERALELAPGSAAIFSALLFHRHYQSPVDAQQIFAAHQRFGAMMRQRIAAAARKFRAGGRIPRAACASATCRRISRGIRSAISSSPSFAATIASVTRCFATTRIACRTTPRSAYAHWRMAGGMYSASMTTRSTA